MFLKKFIFIYLASMMTIWFTGYWNAKNIEENILWIIKMPRSYYIHYYSYYITNIVTVVEQNNFYLAGHNFFFNLCF